MFAGIQSCDTRIDGEGSEVLRWLGVLDLASLSALLAVVTSAFKIRCLGLAFGRLECLNQLVAEILNVICPIIASSWIQSVHLT